MQKLQRNNTGFTIIEVLIVLAIAGLIMLIVFLAVPALQRNSRNSSRRNDASRISSAVTEFTNNNNGQPPADWGDIKPFIGDMSFYTPLPDDTASIGTVSDGQEVTNADAIPTVATGGSCNTDGSAQTGGTDRQFVVLYAVETGGATGDSQCIES